MRLATTAETRELFRQYSEGDERIRLRLVALETDGLLGIVMIEEPTQLLLDVMKAAHSFYSAYLRDKAVRDANPIQDVP